MSFWPFTFDLEALSIVSEAYGQPESTNVLICGSTVNQQSWSHLKINRETVLTNEVVLNMFLAFKEIPS